MRELPEPKITPVLLEDFKRVLAGGRGDLDAWLEVNNEAEVREFVLAIQKQAYEDGLMDATQRLAESSADVDDMFAKIHASPAFELESVRKSFGAAMLTASQKEPQ